MVKPEDLQCWKCGAGLDYLIMPLSRTAHCKACDAAIHVCLMCRFYDPRVAKKCREPIVDEVKDKDRPNFCDYLELNPAAYNPGDASEANAARSDLQALFGLESDDDSTGQDVELSQAEKSRQQLEELFGLKKDD